MPKGHARLTCRICERPRSEVGSLSKRGKCQECATAMVAANILGLAHHEGPFFDHWRRQHAASVGGILLEDLQKAG